MRALLLSFLTAAAAFAQVSGRVLDPSGSIVPEARVSIVHRASMSQVTAVTDPNGAYSFTGLRDGEWLIEAQASGFGSSRAENVELIGGAGKIVDLTLAFGLISTQVQVTAAGGAQTVDEQGKALTTIDTQQLTDRAEYQIADAVRTVPGIRVQQLGGPGSFVRILTRGMRSQDTSVLVDGFRLRDAASPQGDVSAFLGDLLLADTDRIEVLRGSGSSLYGTHSTGGTINIITAAGASGFHGEIGAEGGGLGLFQGIAKASGGAFDQRLRYSVGATHLNVTKGIDGNDRARNSLGHGLIQYRLGQATELSARILASDSFAQLNTSPYLDENGQPVLAPDDPDNSRSAGYFSGLFAASHQWSPAIGARISYQGVSTRRDNGNGPAGVSFQPETNTLDRFDGRLDTIQARTDLQFPKNWITAGYEWEREHFDNISQPADARLRISQWSNSVFAQDQLQLLDRRLQISFSGRLQAFELNRPQFSDNSPIYNNATLESPPMAKTGDVSIAYFAQPTGTKFRAHVGNGYRVPSLYERFGASYFFGSFSALGDPALRPDRLLAFDAGIDQYLGSRTKISATYFYTRIQEAIVFDFSGFINPETDPYGRFGGYRNTGGGLARGVELSLETAPIRSMILRSSYTYTNADERTSIFPSGILRTPRVSDHMFTATATQRFGRAFDVTFDLFAASEYLMALSSQAVYFDGPVKADLSANYTRALTDALSLRFFTRVDNFLNRSYSEEGFRAPKAWATFGMRLLF